MQSLTRVPGVPVHTTHPTASKIISNAGEIAVSIQGLLTTKIISDTYFHDVEGVIDFYRDNLFNGIDNEIFHLKIKWPSST